MYITEKEIKVLNVNPQNIIEKLIYHGCKYTEENIQKYYVYNFKPLASEIIATINNINNVNIDNKYKSDLKIYLLSLFNELFSIIEELEVKEIISAFKTKNIQTFYKNILNNNFIELSNKFIQILNKYTFNPNKWIRLRQTGEDITLTIKNINRSIKNNINNYNINQVKELEFKINDFEKADFFLKELGYYYKAYQEKKRISYNYDKKIKFEIDFWPLIPAYLEIESNDVDAINDWIKKLEINEKDIQIMNTDDVFKIYGYDIYNYKILSFNRIELY